MSRTEQWKEKRPTDLNYTQASRLAPEPMMCQHSSHIMCSGSYLLLVTASD